MPAERKTHGPQAAPYLLVRANVQPAMRGTPGSPDSHRAVPGPHFPS